MKIITRDFTYTLKARLAEDLNFMQVVIGPRQVGKTTGLDQIVSTWQGTSLMVTADELAAPNRDWLTLQWQRAEQKGPGTLLVIDEVQKIPQWSDTVKYLFDRDRQKLKVVLLGSASLSLQRGLNESLAGRYEVIHANHWNLNECQKSLGWSLTEYLKFGGYPAAGELIEDIDRWQNFMRNSIVEPVLFKDILGLSSVAKPALFRQTFELSMSYPAREISLQKILGQLQDRGNVTTIKHYLELLEGAFLIRILQKYTGSEVKKRASSPKIVPLNNGLVHAFRDPGDMDSEPEWRGRIFEAAVGAALTTVSGGKLYYWREGKYEVDYILCLNRKTYAVEVKSGRRRNINGLSIFLKHYPDSIPVIIDRDNVETLLRATDVGDLFREGKIL
jgi:predicted AAA+ superfamily ATPase